VDKASAAEDAATHRIRSKAGEEHGTALARRFDGSMSGVYHPKAMRASLRAPLLAMAWLAVSPALPAGGASADEALRNRLRRVEAAFRQGDALALRGCFSDKAKVRVELGDLSEGQGLYGAGQLQVIFGRIFEKRRTRSMSFPRADVKVPAVGTAFARGVWVHLGSRSADERTDSLMLTLHADDGDWRIIEMRSAR